MNLLEMAQLLAPQVRQTELTELCAGLDPSIPADWRHLACITALATNAKVIAVSGGQGAGKSTFAQAIRQAHELLGRNTVVCSIDDFYLTKGARKQLGESVHPLLETRGVPGTHDVKLASDTLDALRRGARVSLPRFDKGLDDRLAADQWPVNDKVADTVVFEGWCLGVTAVDTRDLVQPVNLLEEREDPDGGWRRYVNQSIQQYLELWERVDFWIFLAVPDMAAVLRWRKQQERSLPAQHRMTDPMIERFVGHYERLTRRLLETMPGRCDWAINLAADHTIANVTNNTSNNTPKR
ncbi:MAG: kinase [Proteobacteria bacterium]|nr:kinase [Pseudomonadota bacterium]